MIARKSVKKLKITQIRSSIGRRKKAKQTMTALGLRRMHQTVLHADTPEIRGMIRQVDYLVTVEEVK